MDGKPAHVNLDLEQMAKDAIDDLYAEIEGRNLADHIQQLERVEAHLKLRLSDLKGH